MTKCTKLVKHKDSGPKIVLVLAKVKLIIYDRMANQHNRDCPTGDAILKYSNLPQSPVNHPISAIDRFSLTDSMSMHTDTQTTNT